MIPARVRITGMDYASKKTKSLIKFVDVGNHAKWIFTELYIDTFSKRCQKDSLPRLNLVPENHFQNIEKIGPFGDDF